MMMQGKQMIQVNWNQWIENCIVNTDNYDGYFVRAGELQSREDGLGVYRYSESAAGTSVNNFGPIFPTKALASEHKYYAAYMGKYDMGSSIYFRVYSFYYDRVAYDAYRDVSTTLGLVSGIVTAISNISPRNICYINISNFWGVVSLSNRLYFTVPKFIDLTTMFGAGNEPTTEAQFEQWLQENGIDPSGYIPYNEGEMRMMTKPSWIP